MGDSEYHFLKLLPQSFSLLHSFSHSFSQTRFINSSSLMTLMGGSPFINSPPQMVCPSTGDDPLLVFMSVGLASALMVSQHAAMRSLGLFVLSSLFSTLSCR